MTFIPFIRITFSRLINKLPHHFFSWLPACMLMTALVAPLGAQTPNGSEPQTFRVISAIGSYWGLKYDLKKTSNGAASPIDISINQTLSTPYIRPPGTQLELYREIPPPPDAPPGTKPTRLSILSVVLPATAPDCIVVVFPLSPDRKGVLKAQVVVGNPEVHRSGTVQLINFSSTPAAVAIDNANYTLASGETKIVPAGSGRGRMLFQTAIDKHNRWVPVFRGERRLDPRLRGYVFFYDYMVDPDYGSDPTPPPALVKLMFELSPDSIRDRKLKQMQAAQARAGKGNTP